MIPTRTAALFAATLLIAVACAGKAATPSPAPTAVQTAAPTDAPSTAICDNLSADAAGDLLETICNAGKILVSTDPNYKPQSFLKPDGTFEGFDIDTANEIGKRLGVTVQFETPSFDAVVAGGWSGRWDISVGSVTVTEERTGILDFTEPYYYTPAQMAATVSSAITTLDGLAGKAICVGSSTTYQFWLEGTLNLVGSPEPATPPTGATAFPLGTDQDCAQSVASGRSDFDGWLSSSTTVKSGIDAGTEVVPVGDPVFYEALAVAVDKSAPDHDALLAALDQIISDMHDDGYLTASSEEWFDGLDLTVTQ